MRCFKTKAIAQNRCVAARLLRKSSTSVNVFNLYLMHLSVSVKLGLWYSLYHEIVPILSNVHYFLNEICGHCSRCKCGKCSLEMPANAKNREVRTCHRYLQGYCRCWKYILCHKPPGIQCSSPKLMDLKE